MIEDILFGNVEVPGEIARIILAFAGVIIAAYYDIFNKKNIPDKFLYGFLAVSVLANLIFFNLDVLLFTFAIAAFFSAIGYIFYRVGQMGGADVIILACIMLLMPLVPSFSGMVFNMPFILPIMIFAGLLFGIYTTVKFGIKIAKEGGQPKLLYLLMTIPYALFAYFYITSPFFSLVFFLIITVLLIATTFFMMYKNDINMMLAEELPMDQLEPEDVVAFEVMDNETVKKLDMKRVLNEKEIERLKKAGVESIWIYTQLPPFIPFLLAGMILALFFSNSLMFGLY